jgi:sugar lactone lactonase YvrE
MSPDASTAYVVASDHSEILVFDFNTGATSSIPLTSATGSPVSPVAASMTVDGDLIYVAASDGELHEVSTLLNTDLMQISFPNLPDVNNPFCSSGSTTIACNLDLVAVKQ